MIKSFVNKIKYLFVFTAIFLVSFSNAIFAKNNVKNINIDVLIHNNGSATISQQWTGTFNEGTEIYIPIEDKSLIVRNLRVWKNGEEYLYNDKWDVNASFEQKRYRCGINKTSKGVEICFGISEYGTNGYTFSYDIDPLVKSYTDSDGFNFQFLNPEMDIYPSSASLRIRLENEMQITEDNARIWGFGFNGEVNFANGYAVAFTTQPLQTYNYMNITLELFKGLVRPNISVDSSFESLRDTAFENSTYQEILDKYGKEDSGLSLFDIIFFGTIAVFIFGAITAFVAEVKRKNTLKKFYKDGNYFRDTPNDGQIVVSHALFKDFDIWSSKESNVIGAIIMKMINDGNLEPLKETSYGFFGTEKTNTSLKVVKEPTADIVKELYDLIVRAAGDDGILQENELKKYATANYKEFNNYLDSLESRGHNLLNLKNGYNKIAGKSLSDLTDVGQKELSEVYGLRKFLDEFTLISERSLTEGIIWENLMVYATLFGIAKKVLGELKEMYPDRIVEIEKYSNTYYISNSYYRTLYYSSMNARRAAEAKAQAMRSAHGFGGSASIGGGGGFSGGGHGGGTR